METIVSTPPVPGAGGTRGESRPVADCGLWQAVGHIGLIIAAGETDKAGPLDE